MSRDMAREGREMNVLAGMRVLFERMMGWWVMRVNATVKIEVS